MSVLQLNQNSRYLGHVSPHTDEAKTITAAIVQFLKESKINNNELKAVGCDGTNVNTGAVGGVIRLQEEQIGKTLQWFVCFTACK